MVFGKCDNSLDIHLGTRKNLIFNLFVRWPKIIEFYLHIQMLTYQQSWRHFSWTTLHRDMYI